MEKKWAGDQVKCSYWANLDDTQWRSLGGEKGLRAAESQLLSLWKGNTEWLGNHTWATQHPPTHPPPSHHPHSRFLVVKHKSPRLAFCHTVNRCIWGTGSCSQGNKHNNNNNNNSSHLFHHISARPKASMICNAVQGDKRWLLTLVQFQEQNYNRADVSPRFELHFWFQLRWLRGRFSGTRNSMTCRRF